MFVDKLKKLIQNTPKKSYRQVKLVQGNKKGEEVEFSVDIPDEADGVEKLDQLMKTVVERAQMFQWQEENR